MEHIRIKLTGADAILRVLATAGVREAFGIASGKLAPFYRALAQAENWQYVGVRHEASAAFMATAVYAGTGRLALTLAETGPGGLNQLSALGGASANNLAVIAITSSNTSRIMAPNRGGFSSTDNERLYRPIVKWNATIRHPERIPEIVRQAVRTALAGRPGPVHLDVPAEILAAEHEYLVAELDALPHRYAATASYMPVPSAIQEAAARIEQAHHILLIAGGGAVRSDASAALGQLLDRIPAVAMTTHMGLGAIPASHPALIGQGGFFAGPAAMRAFREADLVIAVGCRFSSFMWMDGPPSWEDFGDRQLIQIDIDPTSLGQNIPLHLGLIGDARATVQEIVSALPNRDISRGAWHRSIMEERDAYRNRLRQLAAGTGDVLHPATLAANVARFIGDDDIVTFDGGHTSFWSNDYTPAVKPATRFHEAGMCHIGFGLPWALALARCFPDRRTFCLTGDGSFGFTLQELDTARREGINVVTVVHNNASWGVIRAGQQRGGFNFGADLSGTDYAEIARGFGCHGEKVVTVDQIGPAMERALGSGKPAVIDAHVLFDPHPLMPVFGKSTG